jgi:hypothetical protein
MFDGKKDLEMVQEHRVKTGIVGPIRVKQNHGIGLD